MDETETLRFQNLIEARLAELDIEDARGLQGQSTVVLDQQAVGRLSRQDALLNQSMAKATQARRDGLRRALLAALDRLKEEEFGYCNECGDEIAPKRLELDPTATRCISCARG
ncbi:TraR/DksA family transcriptional regulator [Primorskyibacter sp. 2E233]|uniref:TraR/DksA family transcriptional regulator n=1 Tax=Primorskyibacter sp. 2E233 TaxID=3413431 RepID=UPI003BF208A3